MSVKLKIVTVNIGDLDDETGDEDQEEKYDFNAPEDVIIDVCEREEPVSGWGWKKYIEDVQVIPRNDGVEGAASYDNCYGSLDYSIQDMCEEPPAPGCYIVGGVTGVYTRGDGWSIDDDFELSCTGIRPATNEEIVRHFGAEYFHPRKVQL